MKTDTPDTRHELYTVRGLIRDLRRTGLTDEQERLLTEIIARVLNVDEEAT